MDTRFVNWRLLMLELAHIPIKAQPDNWVDYYELLDDLEDRLILQRAAEIKQRRKEEPTGPWTEVDYQQIKDPHG